MPSGGLDGPQRLNGRCQRNGAAGARGVGVAAQHVDETGARKRQHALARSLVGQERSRRLHQRSPGHEPSESLPEVRSKMSLRVRHQRTEAPSTKPLDRAFESVAERPRRRFEEDPTARASERHGSELAVAEPIERRGSNLAAGEDERAAARLSDRRRELRNPRGQLGDPHIVVVANMRRRADGLDTVGLPLLRHRERVIEIARAVVETRQEMAVKVDRDP